MNTEDILRRAFLELYPHRADHIHQYEFEGTFSGKFSGYNANIRYTKVFSVEKIKVNMSRAWKEVSEEIMIGLVQSLLVKLFNKRLRQQIPKTMYMEMYEIFIKKVGNYAPITKSDPVLSDSFDRINQKYFNGLIDKPNLQFGGETFRKLGSYEYQSDTITISATLKDNIEFIDYVMHHEMLHKKHKYYTKNGRSFHHHAAFRNDEAKYENHAVLEKSLTQFVFAKKRMDGRRKKTFLSWFLE